MPAESATDGQRTGNFFVSMTKRKILKTETKCRVYAAVALLLLGAECRTQNYEMLCRPTFEDKFGNNLLEIEEQTTDVINEQTSSKTIKFPREGEIIEKKKRWFNSVFYTVEKQIPVEEKIDYVRAMER